MEQMPGVLDGSMLNVTGFPEPPPLADTVYCWPGVHGHVGAAT